MIGVKHSRDILRTESEIIASWEVDDYKPLVSVNCITYNHACYIEDAIIGFLRQETNFPFEILIYDDASTDATTEIIKNFEKDYPRIIKVIYQNENQYPQGKVLSSFNVKRAMGEYVAACEGDDYWISSSHLQDAVDVLDNNSDVTIYGSACCVEKGSKIVKSNIKSSNYDLISYIEESPFVTTCSLVTRTSIWREVLDIPVYGKRYFAGDTRLKLLCLAKGDMVVNQTPSVVYRKGTVGSWSNRIITENLIIRELLDNLSITREVGVVNDYQASGALYARVEKETLTKGLALASHKGFFSWLGFVLTHLKVCSPKMIRVTVTECPMVKWIRN